MIAKLRIPTKEQYAYIEIEAGVKSVEDAYVAYTEAMHMIHGGAGLPQKAWNAAIDEYLNKGTGNTEQYVQMSQEQQRVIQEIKRAFKRLKYDQKNIDENSDVQDEE